MNVFEPTRTSVARNSKSSAHSSRAKSIAASWLLVFGGLCLIAAGCAAPLIQAPAPGAPLAPPPPPYAGPTIPKLLGIPECFAAGKACCIKIQTCCKRQFPGPGEPPNLGPVGPGSSPAVKCAAEILAAEAEAPQKIDALRYLGQVGCTKCYPCVEEGLVAALDDCTESVRFEAAKAIRATASDQCKCCQCTSCCTQKIYDKLYKVAYETNSDGCPVECSSRVRRVARQALCMCGGPMVSDDEEEPTPAEGPSGAAPAIAPPPVPPQETQAKAATSAATPATVKPAEAAAAVPPAAEKKEAAKPATGANEHKSASVTPIDLDLPPNLVPASATDAASSESVIPNPLRNATVEKANGCRACGTKGLASDPPNNPFRQVTRPQKLVGPTIQYDVLATGESNSEKELARQVKSR